MSKIALIEQNFNQSPAGHITLRKPIYAEKQDLEDAYGAASDDKKLF